MRTRNEFARARARARWTVEDLGGVVEAVLASAPERLWSADDVRVRLGFGHEEAGPAASSVREALAALEREGRIERVDVWGRRGWGNARNGYRAGRAPAQGRLTVAA
jgi:hypothetical protein